MPHSFYRKRSRARAFVSAMLALMMLSLNTAGYATPRSTTAVEPASQESTGVAQPSGGTSPDTTTSPGAPQFKHVGSVSSGPRLKGGKTSVATRRAAARTMTVAAPSITSAAASSKVTLTLEGYNTEQAKWTTGNLGKLFAEGDWVAHRLIIDNTNGASSYAVPDLSFSVDHYNSQQNAIFYDKTGSWGYYLPGSVGSGDTQSPSTTSLTAATQDAPYPSGTYGSCDRLQTTFSSPLTVPAGGYAVVYFRAHLAVTAYWNQQSPARSGAGGNPGSSGGTRVTIGGVGDRTVPLPSVDAPAAYLHGVKFNDLNGDGVQQSGEPVLSGWTFHLVSSAGGYPLDVTTTTGADGTFTFGPLPAETFTLSEENQTGWVNTTGLPKTYTFASGQETTVAVGNWHPDITKTFRLTLADPLVDVTYFARYTAGGVSHDVPLSGSGVYTGSVKLPWGTNISTEWYAVVSGENVLLGRSAAETLTSDYTNCFTYNNTLSGSKFNDVDGNGVWDSGEPGIEGWTIRLLKVVPGAAPVVYATTTTGSDGHYVFRDVLPGTYRLAEENVGGWYNTVSPDTTLTVGDGACTSNLDFGNVLSSSGIHVTKTGPAYAYESDTITYTVTVTNTGNLALTNVNVYDTLMGTVGTIPSLAAGESRTYELPWTVAADPDPLPNTVEAVGHDVFGAAVSDDASWTVDVYRPALRVTKTASAPAVVTGGAVTYTYLVENTGDVALKNVAVTDDKLGDVGTIGDLAAGASATLTKDATLTASTTNVATVTGDDPTGRTLTDTDAVSVPAYSPSISVVKTASDVTVLPGTEVAYTYLVTNTGDIALSNVRVVDDKLGAIGTVATLLPGATVTFTRSAALADDVTNVATASGDYGSEGSGFFGTVCDTDDASVDVVNPGLRVTKTASAPAVVTGGAVTYTYLVENTGDVALKNVAVTDDKLGDVGTIGDLAAGASATLTKDATLTASTTNVATVTGDDPTGRTLTDTDTVSVPAYSPSISVVKTASDVTVLPGTEVAYTYLVTNTGDIALSNVRVVDDKLGAIGTVATLLPGATVTFTRSAALADDVTNVATASGDYGSEGSGFFGTVCDTDDASVDVISPAISLDKSADVPAVVSGETVTYTYVVRNTGDVALSAVTLTDDKLGAIGQPIDLAAGDVTTFTAQAALTASTTNVATVVGHDGDGDEVSATDSATVAVYDPAIAVTKVADPLHVLSDETVSYRYEVRNTGDIALSNVHLTDDKLGAVGDPMTLQAGESASFVVTTTLAADTTNVVTAEGAYGEAGSGFSGTVSASATADVDVVAPAVALEKSASVPAVLVGGQVTYTYVVRNTGDVALGGLTVVDDKLDTIGTVETLAVGEAATLTASTALETSTVNVATVSGADEFGHEVSACDQASVPAYNPAITVAKSGTPDTIESGDDVTYVYVVRNTGDIGLWNVQVVDDKLGPIGTIAALAPGEAMTFSRVAPIAVDTENIATATGSYGVEGSGFFGSVSAQASETVNVIAPEVRVTKTASTPAVVSGGSVTYTYVVENTGDVRLSALTVDDDKLGHLADIASLAVGESSTITTSTTLAASTTNVVTVSGTDETGRTVTDTDTATVAVYDPAISVSKTADPLHVLSGESVTYSYTVKNTGDIALTGVTLVDDKLGAVGSPLSLGIGESASFTATAALAEDTVNVVTATGSYGQVETPFAGQVSAQASATVDVVSPSVTIVKTSDAAPEGVDPGTLVTYTYEVANNGDVPLQGVVVDDDKLGQVADLGNLAVGESRVVTAAAVLTTDTTNVGTVSGADEYGHPVTAEDSETVVVLPSLPFTPADLGIEKSADRDSVKAGDLVTYTLTYQNVSGGAATDFTIVDDFDQRYATVVDAGGGAVADGKITWDFAGPLYTSDGAQTLTYTVRISSDLPDDVTRIDNVVVVNSPDDTNPDNDSDSLSLPVTRTTSTTTAETGLPFLPFTGGTFGWLFVIAAVSAGVGLVLRRRTTRA